MSWNENLDRASWRGVEFDCQKLSDDLMRRWARFTYPYKNGADLEDMGREPRSTKVTAVFFGPEYQTDLGALMLVVDAGKAGTFKHPLLGTWKARCSISSIDHDETFRDGCMVELELVEDGTDNELPTVFSVAALKDKVTAEALVLEAAVDDLPSALAGVSEVLDQFDEVLTLVEDFVADVEEEIAYQVDRAQNELRVAVADGIDLCREYFPDENDIYAVVQSSHLVLEHCRQLAARAMSSAATWEQYVMNVEGPLVFVSFDLYQDASRVEELEAMNQIRNPNRLEIGAAITVFAAASEDLDAA